MKKRSIILPTVITAFMMSYNEKRKNKTFTTQTEEEVTAKDILGNPDYSAISYGGYRKPTREIQPTIDQIKEDMKILHAMNIKVLRTYNVQFAHASNVLKAISELKKEDPSFEMYVMLGAWIDCHNAWTGHVPNHEVESEHNTAEIDRAVALAKAYPDIVKIIAVGNEAMVHWATSYFVRPNVILKWVNHCQELKKNGELPKDLWITTSDDFSSWGGGDPIYRTEDLIDLIKAVDYISMHTYPMHNSHYNPEFWLVPNNESNLPNTQKVEAGMQRALEFATNQYHGVINFVKSLGLNKPVHIGETGWATHSNGHYGVHGSKAADELKSGKYYKLIRDWSHKEQVSCFYFEAFDEPWKDANNKGGSENHFGLLTYDGQAKYALWDLVDKDVFKGLTRDGKTISKTFNGNKEDLLLETQVPPLANSVLH
ncbi:glycosyl hydrolase family 17 [Winogradskyella sp. R77965]|uniref:glycosyl hydrolase family 17 n=1 Tax=Winogradskyella sp. R77965 TaxID=3093872 RepID=UPI0037DD7BAB